MQSLRKAALAFLASATLLPSSANGQELADQVFAAIDAKNDGLRTINTEIWENPEIGYQEVHAHKVLTDYLEEQGFNVTRSAYNLTTAFRAEFSNGPGRAVSFNSEFDALPGLGHACGHNLIATVGVAAAIGVKEALENGNVKGSVVQACIYSNFEQRANAAGYCSLLGTPAEEGGGGKVKMLEAGAYDGLDCSLMAHPGNSNYAAWGRTLASWRGNVSWTGVAAHAAAAPWAGQNALDGFVAAYQMAGLFRQQLQPSDRIHHVVTKGWSVANIIPDYIESQWGVRGNTRQVRHRRIRVESILYASGNGTNTTVEISAFQDYWDQNPSFQLASTFYEHQMKYLNPADDPETANFTVSSPEDSRRDGGASASSDQGNVSWFLPAIQVGFPVGGTAPVHNAGFRELAGTEFAHESAIQTAKILALTGLKVLQNETYAETMWEEWRAMIEEVSIAV
ncbi:Aminobenzoyl-glutamate utilization protein B [Colletotrichum higginsianum IMI 349063]|uniref:Peptidase M20 domain-containing protein 2 n=1 Tax=Colletotrichum higginsianum (strain IMI 349063) TaxID=759273 RepID=A0A1B7YGB4_COLHI|nr:Aminobenzoyl-glutamate utilization protein B [Colletotrichum higginsianum IMI 349063]OBR11117.1 Aminobenzoyl-glutamate utilization protein B [Colletotrichum higginsianum IMI 349063]